MQAVTSQLVALHIELRGRMFEGHHADRLRDCLPVCFTLDAQKLLKLWDYERLLSHQVWQGSTCCTRSDMVSTCCAWSVSAYTRRTRSASSSTAGRVPHHLQIANTTRDWQYIGAILGGGCNHTLSACSTVHHLAFRLCV